MNRVLAGLGVDEYSTGNITLDTKLNEISSGQLRRVMIACALYSRPHLLILDDPTSHLDVVSVKWLSNYLKTTRSAVIIASNNRGFVDACATQTIGLTDIGRVFVFSGGYSEFEQKRDAVIKAEEDAKNKEKQKKCFEKNKPIAAVPIWLKLAEHLKQELKNCKNNMKKCPAHRMCLGMKVPEI